MHRCANTSMGENRAFYPTANCDLPLQGSFRQARRLVTRKLSSGCVAVLLPSSRVSFREGPVCLQLCFISICCQCLYVFRNNFIHEVLKVQNTRIYFIKTLTCSFIHLMFLLNLKNKYNEPSQKCAFILIRIE